MEFLMVPAIHPSLPASVFYITLHQYKTGTRTPSVVDHMIRNRCVYRAHEYFIDNSGELECISCFKIRLLRCHSKVVWNNLTKFICTKALWYAPSASHWSVLIKSFEYWTNPEPSEYDSQGMFLVMTQINSECRFSSLMTVALSFEYTSFIKENVLARWSGESVWSKLEDSLLKPQ